MMTDDVDELLREAEAKFDQAIIELAIEEGNRLTGCRRDWPTTCHG